MLHEFLEINWAISVVITWQGNSDNFLLCKIKTLAFLETSDIFWEFKCTILISIVFLKCPEKLHGIQFISLRMWFVKFMFVQFIELLFLYLIWKLKILINKFLNNFCKFSILNNSITITVTHSKKDMDLEWREIQFFAVF